MRFDRQIRTARSGSKGCAAIFFLSRCDDVLHGAHRSDSAVHSSCIRPTYTKRNGLLRYSQDREQGGRFSVTVQASSILKQAIDLPNATSSAPRYNVLDSNDRDITYFYESQLAGETEPVADIHFHPVEPRTVRFTLSASF